MKTTPEGAPKTAAKAAPASKPVMRGEYLLLGHASLRSSQMASLGMFTNISTSSGMWQLQLEQQQHYGECFAKTPCRRRLFALLLISNSRSLPCAAAAAAGAPKAAVKPEKADAAEAAAAGPDHWSYWSDNTNRALLAAQAANEGGNYGEWRRCAFILVQKH